MQLNGLLWGRQLLQLVDFPCAEVLGPQASVDDIKALIERRGEVLIKPIYKGGIGQKGKSGLIGRAKDVRTALREKERLFFAHHEFKGQLVKAEGVTFEGFVESRHEVYVSITESTRFRAPCLCITHHGGVDIEELPEDKIRIIPFDPLTGLKSFQVGNALMDLGAPNEILSPLVQFLPSLWTLYDNYGMDVLELNPIRMSPTSKGRLKPVACDFKCSFDINDPAWQRLGLPNHLFISDHSQFEQEVNQLRTHQGQSDVYVMNPKGTVTALTFGGGANALVTELLGERATISSDFGGNPPYEKMLQISKIVFKYWLEQSNVLFVIGGKANNTDIFTTFRAIADALRWYFQNYGPKPIFVVLGRGGPNVIRGMSYFKDVVESYGLPYRFFGYDSAISEVINYVLSLDQWLAEEGREKIEAALNAQLIIH